MAIKRTVHCAAQPQGCRQKCALCEVVLVQRERPTESFYAPGTWICVETGGAGRSMYHATPRQHSTEVCRDLPAGNYAAEA